MKSSLISLISVLLFLVGCDKKTKIDKRIEKGLQGFMQESDLRNALIEVAAENGICVYVGQTGYGNVDAKEIMSDYDKEMKYGKWSPLYLARAKPAPDVRDVVGTQIANKLSKAGLTVTRRTTQPTPQHENMCEMVVYITPIVLSEHIYKLHKLSEALDTSGEPLNPVIAYLVEIEIGDWIEYVELSSGVDRDGIIDAQHLEQYIDLKINRFGEKVRRRQTSINREKSEGNN